MTLARVEAYVALSSAAWDAVDAREQFGADSPEYAAARARTDRARAVYLRTTPREIAAERAERLLREIG